MKDARSVDDDGAICRARASMRAVSSAPLAPGAVRPERHMHISRTRLVAARDPQAASVGTVAPDPLRPTPLFVRRAGGVRLLRACSIEPHERWKLCSRETFARACSSDGPSCGASVGSLHHATRTALDSCGGCHGRRCGRAGSESGARLDESLCDGLAGEREHLKRRCTLAALHSALPPHSLEACADDPRNVLRLSPLIAKFFSVVRCVSHGRTRNVERNAAACQPT